jgi:hypothetical protein
MHRVEIRLRGDTAQQELESLFSEIQGDTRLRPWAVLPAKPPQHGELGGLGEVIMVAVGTGGSLTVLASAVSTWAAHPRGPKIKLSVRADRSGAREVEIEAERVSAEEVEALLRSALDDPGE